VIRYSLEKYGRRVDVDELMGQVKNRSLQEEFLDWPITPTEWIILLTIRQHGGAIDQQTLQEQLLHNPTNPKPYTLTETQLQTALKNLTINTAKRDTWLTTYKKTTNQQQAYQEIQLNDKPETNQKEVCTQIWRLNLSDKKAKQLLDTHFYGEKSGGVKHVQAIMAQCKLYWQNGWITQIDTGETEKSIADIYATPTTKTVTTTKETKQGYISPTDWDYLQSFAVEIETYPSKHFDRLNDHYTRNKKMGFPTLYIVPTKTDKEKLKEKLIEWKATYVQNTAQFKPNHPEQVAIEINHLLSDQNSNQTSQTTQPPTTKLIETSLGSSNQTPAKPTLENDDSFENTPVELSLEVLEKERLMLKFVGEGWYFRLKEVKNKSYLCVRKFKEEHSLGSFTNEIKYIAEKNKIKIKKHKEK
jgi:hypothetical protein